MKILMAVPATVNVTDEPVGFTATVSPTTDASPAGVDIYDATATAVHGYLDAIDNNPRYGDFRLLVDGVEIDHESLHGVLKVTRSIDSNPVNTCEFAVLGDEWGMPAGLNAWGNKKLDLYLSAGRPGKMVERKVFTGRLYDKPTQDTSNQSSQTIGSWKAVDDSLSSGAESFCYELQPYSGKTRGEIIREWAAIVGDTIEECPIGSFVDMPISLSNARFFDELKKFIAPEGWYASRSAAGGIVIRPLALGRVRQTLDESARDWLLGSFTETPPEAPPTRYFARGFLPNNDTTGLNGTTITVAETSGPDGITRTTTETVLRNGKEILFVQTIQGPLTLPVIDGTKAAVTDGTDSNGHTRYKHAGGTPPTPTTVHDVEVSRYTRSSRYDSDWNLVSQHIDFTGWYAPKGAFGYLLTSESAEVNGAAPRAPIGALTGDVYTDGTVRTAPFAYGTIQTQDIAYVIVHSDTDGDINFVLTNTTTGQELAAPQCAIPQNLASYLALDAPGDETTYYGYGTTPDLGWTGGTAWDFGGGDWRAAAAEVFQNDTGQEIDTYVTAGIVSEVKTVNRSFMSAEVGSGYPYPDGTHRAQDTMSYNVSSETDVGYSQLPDGSFAVLTLETDFVKGTSSSTPSTAASPPAPQWPESQLTLYQTQPTIINYNSPDLSAAFVANLVVVDASYCETIDQMRTVIAMEARRDTAVVRTVTTPADSSRDLGNTDHIVCARRSIDDDHFITGIATQVNLLTGGQYDTLTAEWWTR